MILAFHGHSFWERTIGGLQRAKEFVCKTADFHGIATCELNVYVHAYRFHFTDEKQIPQKSMCWWCRPGDDTSIASFLWQAIASGDVRVETYPDLY